MPGGGSLNPVAQETVDKKMHYVHQDGQQVFKFAVRKQTEACEKLLARNGLKGSDIDAFIPHQANLRIINATADRLGLRPEAVIVNIERYGNTTAGTIPLAMDTADRGRQAEEGKPGDAGLGGRRLYRRGDAAALGVLKIGLRLLGLVVLACYGPAPLARSRKPEAQSRDFRNPVPGHFPGSETRLFVIVAQRSLHVGMVGRALP